MSDASTTPTVLGGRYELGGRLARGGMADIFLAQDQVLERQVVIKMLLPQYAGDPAFVERFRREAKSAAKLNHANVVAVYDWGSHNETWFMAMEYIEGQSLAELLVADGKLPVTRAVQITSEAAAGLGFAHDHGMVHRDVKPGNIMLTDSGQVKVADFGIARALDGGESLTQTGNVMGTAAYFSPEQARGEEVDPRSDLYSLGVVLFEMVTGERPFSGTSPLSVAYKHVGEAPPTPSTVNANLPPSIDAVISTLLAKDPNGRYRDANELRAELHRVVSGEHVHGAASAAMIGSDQAATAMTPEAGFANPSAGIERTAAMSAPGPGMVAERQAGAAPPVHPNSQRRGGNGAFIMALAALLVAAVVLIFVIAGALGGDEGSNDPNEAGLIQVPTVTDENEQSARNKIENANLVPEIERVPDDTRAAGIVISQDPAAQADVEPGSVVSLLVSSGPESEDDGEGEGTSTTTSDPESPTTESSTDTSGSDSSTSSSQPETTQTTVETTSTTSTTTTTSTTAAPTTTTTAAPTTTATTAEATTTETPPSSEPSSSQPEAEVGDGADGNEP